MPGKNCQPLYIACTPPPQSIYTTLWLNNDTVYIYIFFFTFCSAFLPKVDRGSAKQHTAMANICTFFHHGLLLFSFGRQGEFAEDWLGEWPRKVTAGECEEKWHLVDAVLLSWTRDLQVEGLCKKCVCVCLRRCTSVYFLLKLWQIACCECAYTNWEFFSVLEDLFLNVPQNPDCRMDPGVSRKQPWLFVFVSQSEDSYCSSSYSRGPSR